MLRIDAVTYRIAGRLLLEEASATIPPKAKIGLVGRNGSGKTTLFRLILGESAVDGGTITRPTRSTLAAVAQEAPGGAATPLQTVLSADQELTALSAEAEQEDLSPDRIAEVHARLAEIEAHSAEARASAILAGLGFDSAQRQRPLSDFSGGWRMRVALAATLFQRPDYLLLDEPTNHLDLEATVWLENYLLNFPGSLLIISHERRLLNRVANGILHLEGAKLVAYGGNYDTFERTRREKLLLQGKMRERQLAERARIQDFVDRFRAKATKARQAQSRIKMLERMEPVTAVIEEHAPRF
ncbi:MAG: ABC-F family ATP-binding cassette domain-containing protein, partial [Magnetospiraceae bacterium]